MPSGFYESGLSYADITRKYENDCKAGVHDEYNQNIKKIYYEECEIFWKDMKEQYKKEFNDAKKLMMEKLDMMKKLDMARRNQTPTMKLANENIHPIMKM